MKADYKNWVPKGMIWGFGAGCFVAAAVFAAFQMLMAEGVLRTVLLIISAATAVILLAATVWLAYLHCMFSYDGNRSCPGRSLRVRQIMSRFPMVEAVWMWAAAAAR